MAHEVSQAMYYDLDGQLYEIKRQIRQQSGYPFDPERLQLALQEIIEGKFITANVKANHAYPVVVDYAMSLADMIAAGRYDWTNSDITAGHFPFTGEGKAEVAIELVHFGRVIKDGDEGLRELDKMGLRAATLPELLAFGEKYPDMQRQFPVIAFGSVWQDRGGFRDVPGLWKGDRKRSLDLRWFGGGWLKNGRFAAVRK